MSRLTFIVVLILLPEGWVILGSSFQRCRANGGIVGLVDVVERRVSDSARLQLRLSMPLRSSAHWLRAMLPPVELDACVSGQLEQACVAKTQSSLQGVGIQNKCTLRFGDVPGC